MHEIITKAIERSRYLRKNQTQAEKELWKYLRKRQILGFRFLRQHPIKFHISNKIYYFIADFYCHEKKLVIEVDGGIHKKQKDYDELRSKMLEEMKIKVIRFKNEEIENDTNSVLERIKQLL